jgi:3-hydroxyacyl-CoA dehydrogenase
MPRIKPEDVQRIALLGTGTIGCGWAAHYLAQGKTLTVYDPAPDAETRLDSFVENTWPTMQRLGLSPNADPKAFRVVPNAADAVHDAQFVQESAPENVAAKIDLYRQIDDALDPETVVASSTSGLFISELQQGRAGPHRYVVGHPFNPPHIMPLVEVVGGRQTDADVIDWTLAFYRAHGKQAIHIRKEVAGHLANRLQVALLREAVHAVADDIASVEDVDAAVVHALGLRWALIGPHLTVHLAGGPGGIRHHLEHLGPSIENWWNDLGAPQLSPEVNAKLIGGIEEETAGRSFDDLVSERDNLLVELIQTLKKARGES